jgi:predicted ATPase
MGSGPHGVDGRTPALGGYNNGCSVTITDPYILYQNYIAQGMIEKDEQQLRVMKELQKLYYRVVDYTPPEEMAIQMSLLLRKIELQYAESDSSNYFKRIFQRDPLHQRNQLVSYLTDEETLKEIATPHGLLINGEVGCGKSMLLDIFAASLPHKSKMRWHYNTFILWVFNQIHQIQNERFLLNGRNAHKYTLQNEFLLFEVAQKMIDKSTILIFDEFMLPDIALANIIKILFTYFFKLGGVLVATSNKLPEELYSNQFHKKSFDTFVGILHSRCLTTDMRSQLDYRAKFASTSSVTPYLVVEHGASNTDLQWNNLVKTHALKVDSNKQVNELADLEPVSIRVYGRDVKIPMTFNNGKVCYLDFEYICQGLFSSSDYITLASNIEVVIVDNVPIMTTRMKNDARRFISLLDALYEAKCQLFLRCQVDLDYLFFPDAIYAKDVKLLEKLGVARLDDDEVNSLQVQNEEMFAKTTIEMNNPYRPNVSTYDQSFTSTFSEEQLKATDFKDIKAFTGEDEKFAYKRAVLRL